MSWAAVFPVVTFVSKMSRSSLCDSCEVFLPNMSMGTVAFGQANARRTCEAGLPAPSAAAKIGSVHPACTQTPDSRSTVCDKTPITRLSKVELTSGKACPDSLNL